MGKMSNHLFYFLYGYLWQTSSIRYSVLLCKLQRNRKYSLQILCCLARGLLAILTQEEVPRRDMSKHVKSAVLYNIYGL